MSSLKLGVEVVSAHNLMGKEGEGSPSAFVELHFDHQRFRTTTKEKDLNPVWNEKFFFNISDPQSLYDQPLDVYVYNNLKASHTKSTLGKLRLTGTSFVHHSDAVVLHYPLEKRSIFSRVRGELGLKVYITDDPSIRSDPLQANSAPMSDPQSHPNQNQHQTQAQNQSQSQTFASIPNPFTDNKSESRHQFYNLPNQQSTGYTANAAAAAAASSGTESVRYNTDEMRSEPARIARMYSATSASQPPDYALKETSPFLGGGQVVGGRVIRADKPSNTYDLVEQMHFLFVRVVKARDLPAMDITGSCDPYVEIKVGNYKFITKHFEKQQNPEWNEVLAFAKDGMQASFLDVVVKDKDLVKDNFIGLVKFDLNEIPTRVPPDSPLAPQWYKLEDKKGDKVKGELMLAVWIGTQADEAFSEAWHSDAATPLDGISAAAGSAHIRSKVYHSPRLWYV